MRLREACEGQSFDKCPVCLQYAQEPCALELPLCALLDAVGFPRPLPGKKNPATVSPKDVKYITQEIKSLQQQINHDIHTKSFRCLMALCTNLS